MSMASLKTAGFSRRGGFCWSAVVGSLMLPATALAQTPPPGSGSGEPPTAAENPAAAPENPSPVPAKPPAPRPFPFAFTLKGFISGTMYMQDAAFLSGNGNGAIFGPNKTDKWFLGGDVRQTQLKFMVKGPEVLGGIPTGVVEVDLLGGNQVTTVPGQTTVVVVRDAMGNTVGTGTVANTVSSSSMGDESVLPRLRLAYIDLNWGEGTDILRVGQYHNLLIPMIPASASHIGVPLGYGAGAIGWRTPGITYFHKIPLKDEMRLDLALQLNRNSWIDNEPACGPGQAPGPTGTNCLPSGISMGEASSLPQVEARAMLANGKTESPWPYYPSNDWQIYFVGHWDQKVLSGVGPTLPQHDTLQTLIGELGVKVKVPDAAAGRRAAGRDVNGFGAWRQLGLSITKELGLWGFYGIDQPNADEAKAAGFTRLRNMHIAGMASYKDGPHAIAIEFLHVATDTFTPATMTTPQAITTSEGNQPSVSAIYFF